MIIRAMREQDEDSMARVGAGLGLVGLGLTGLGLLQVVSHLSPLLPIYASLCGGTGPFAAAHAMLFEGGHCAGCPMALIGAALLVARLAIRARPKDEAATPALAF